MKTRRGFTKTGRLAVGACTAALLLPTSPPATAEPQDGVRLLDLTTLPHALRFDGTTVGGLSGIDHDPRSGDWVLISDDRSNEQPARFYTADLGVRPDGVHVELTGTEPFLRPNGTVYPPPPGGAVDPESVRFDPWTNDLWWTGEGERTRRMVDPSIRRADPDGSFEGELPLASNLRMREDTGPRQNQALEGLTFAAGGSLVVSAVEGPLIQDGPAPTPEHGALGRITVQDRLGHVLSQYAYPMEPVFAESPAGEFSSNPGFSNNGVSEILSVNRWDPTRYLVMERSFVSGVGNSIRIYEIDTTGATDVRDVPSLRDEPVRPVRKELLVDLADVDGLPSIDNVEGMTWGPRLPNGQRTLVLVSDDNFSASQTTQLIALAVS